MRRPHLASFLIKIISNPFQRKYRRGVSLFCFKKRSEIFFNNKEFLVVAHTLLVETLHSTNSWISNTSNCGRRVTQLYYIETGAGSFREMREYSCNTDNENFSCFKWRIFERRPNGKFSCIMDWNKRNSIDSEICFTLSAHERPDWRTITSSTFFNVLSFHKPVL